MNTGLKRRGPRPMHEHRTHWGDMFKAGKTMEQIGQEVGVSRERVRQVLKCLGLTRKDGGDSLRPRTYAIKRQADIIASKERRAKHWGVDVQTLESLLSQYGHASAATSPFHKYHAQKKNADTAGIEWNLTFSQWWEIWTSSGKFSLVGRGANAYWLSRKDSALPHSPENSIVRPALEALDEGWKRYPKEMRFPKAEERAAT